ncbi:RNA polymerase II-associated protein 3 [Anopheles moucheti]|uniref:RNA polymerase II-associated protein 3 n=1 Tax=Anopheles moucheti TaxID=186751 RepID=UPI0022F01973|nr:RNA polymerase II-associated protein 3 [Anopheles moucheti]XP_052894950.1 RNA polymerase II-associated protein 3 [Anopheles moucheti]
MDAIESQLHVRNKCEQLQKSIKELYEWEERMKTANTAKAQPADNSENKPLPPVRSDVSAMSKFSEDKAIGEKQDQAESETENKKMLADAEMLKERGNKQCKLGNFQEAIELYNQAIKTYGDNAAYYSNRALCYMNLDLFDDCLADCSTAIAKDPKYMKAYYRRMQAYERLGENEKAATECREILRLSQDENELNTAKRDLARIEKRLEASQKSAPSSPGKKSATSAEMDPTLALVKQEADKYKELGNKHLARKDFEKAERSYTKAISLFAEEAIYYTNRSLCYWNLKDYDKCLADCNKAIQLDENYFRPYYRRMQVRELRGAYQSAVEDCRKFIELTKDEKQRGTAEKDLLRLERLVKNEQPAKQAFVWSEIKKNAKLIKFIQKPPHLRSKKPLTRVAIKDLTPCPIVIDNKNLPPPSKCKTIPDAAIDKMFNNNTGERLIEPPEEPTNLEHLFPAHSKKLRNLFSPPTTPTEQKKPFAPATTKATAATGTVPKKVTTNSSSSSSSSSSSTTTQEQKDKPAKKVETVQTNQKKMEKGSQDSNERHPKPATVPVVTPSMRPLSVPDIPRTSAQFYTTWSGLNEDLRYQYLTTLTGTPLWGRLLGASLSNEMLSELLHILQKRFIPDRVEVTSVLKEIVQNESIDLLSLMMNRKDREATEQLLKYMENTGVKKDDVECIRRKLL